MSTYTSADGDASRGGARGAYDDEVRTGWLAFAAVLLLILGAMNVIQGIAAISNAHFFVHNAHYVFGTLNTWGWVAFFLGLVQALVGVGIFADVQAARWTGVALLTVASLVQLLMMPAYPLWALALFATGIFAIYGLVAHGEALE